MIEILPDFLKSASMTAEWENQLLEMEHGKIASEQFMEGIRNMITMMLNGCDQIGEEESRRFQTKESIGTCPVCGSLVYEEKRTSTAVTGTVISPSGKRQDTCRVCGRPLIKRWLRNY